MEPIAPPLSPSKIPRRRPSSSSAASGSTPRDRLSSASSVLPWHATPLDDNDEDPAALQDRRRTAYRTRTRTRTRTRSTDLAVVESPPPPPRRAPLSIEIPKHPPRSRSVSHHHVSAAAPPMSERPRVGSSSAHPAVHPHPRTPRDRNSTTTTTTHTTHATLATPATYESFDFPLPTSTTPPDERDARLALARAERRRTCCGLARLWTARAQLPLDGDGSDRKRRGVVLVGERTSLLDDGGGGGEPAASAKWEYVRGEIVCYAKHMLPPILFFVVLVLVVALSAYKQAIRTLLDGATAEEP
ncbi:hypothetical protein JCM11491_003302 [Sporobolomyces phaffii]